MESTNSAWPVFLDFCLKPFTDIGVLVRSQENSLKSFARIFSIYKKINGRTYAVTMRYSELVKLMTAFESGSKELCSGGEERFLKMMPAEVLRDGVIIRMETPNRFNQLIPRVQKVMLSADEYEKMRIIFTHVRHVFDYPLNTLSSDKVTKLAHIVWSNMLAPNEWTHERNLYTELESLLGKLARALGLELIAPPGMTDSYKDRLADSQIPLSAMVIKVEEQDGRLAKLIEILFNSMT